MVIFAPDTLYVHICMHVSVGKLVSMIPGMRRRPAASCLEDRIQTLLILPWIQVGVQCTSAKAEKQSTFMCGMHIHGSTSNHQVFTKVVSAGTSCSIAESAAPAGSRQGDPPAQPLPKACLCPPGSPAPASDPWHGQRGVSVPPG